jgi:hypothetical protein
VEHERQEADQRMGANTFGLAVVDRGDLDLGFEHAKAALDTPLKRPL